MHEDRELLNKNLKTYENQQRTHQRNFKKSEKPAKDQCRVCRGFGHWAVDCPNKKLKTPTCFKINQSNCLALSTCITIDIELPFPLRACVDTQSQLSIIQRRHLQPEDMIKRPRTEYFRGIAGVIPSLGTVEKSIRIPNINGTELILRHTFEIIDNDVFEVLMGIEFLKQAKYKIDFNKDCMEIMGLLCTVKEKQPQKRNTVYLTEEVKLQPQHMAVLKVECEILEGLSELKIAKSVTDQKIEMCDGYPNFEGGKALILLANHSHKTVTPKKGDKIGQSEKSANILYIYQNTLEPCFIEVPQKKEKEQVTYPNIKGEVKKGTELKFTSLVREVRDLWSETISGTPMGQCNIEIREQTIPHIEPTRRRAPEQNTFMQECMDELRQQGFAKEASTNTSWVAEPVLVKAKNHMENIGSV